MSTTPTSVRALLESCGHRVLDVRAAAEHAAGHLAGAASLPLQPDLDGVPRARLGAWLQERLPSIFLPPHHEPMLVVADRSETARLVAGHLAERGRPAVRWLALTPALLAVLPADLVGRGLSAGVLWQAPAFLRRWVHLLPPPATGPVLDLGCGSGRAAIWLARRGWRVTGIDHQPEALALGRRLAESCRVAVVWQAADLRRPESLPRGPWAAVVMLRFLERDLVGRVASGLGPGGVVVLSTFRDAPGYFGNPRPLHRLRGGEAAALGQHHGLEVLVHEEGFAADGKPEAGVVCRRSLLPL